MVEASAAPITTVQLATELAGFIAGFVAGEGTFGASGDPPSFRFAVSLGASDADTCRLLHYFLGVGTLHEYARRQVHYDDEVTFQVRGLAELVNTVIPFMDEHLPVSYKRTQYLAWRARLLEYWEHGAKRIRPCTVDGCDAARRAHGLCRHHLYEQRGV